MHAITLTLPHSHPLISYTYLILSSIVVALLTVVGLHKAYEDVFGNTLSAFIATFISLSILITNIVWISQLVIGA